MFICTRLEQSKVNVGFSIRFFRPFEKKIPSFILDDSVKTVHFTPYLRHCTSTGCSPEYGRYPLKISSDRKISSLHNMVFKIEVQNDILITKDK